MKRLFTLAVILMSALVLTACTEADNRPRTVIMENGSTSYVIMRSDTASDGDVAAAIAFRSAVEELTGVKLELETDWVNRGEPVPEGTNEILIGSTNRPESDLALLYNDYTWSMPTNRVVIHGGSPEALMKAVESFIDECVTKDGISIPEVGFSHAGEYPMKDALLGGIKLARLGEIAYYDDSLKPIAESIADRLAEAVGVKPKLTRGEARGELAIELGCAADDRRIAGISDVEAIFTSDGARILAATNGSFLPHAEAAELFLTEILESGEYSDTLNERMTIMKDGIEFITKAKLDEYNSQIDARIAEILATETKLEVKGKVYYVSESGNDSNDGLSPEKAWKTLSKVSSADLKAGDGVFFERGGMYRGFIQARSGVTYSAYGKGDKPIINISPFNAADPALWEKTEVENVWRLKDVQEKDIGFMLCNDDIQTVKAIIYHNYEGKEGNHIDYTTRKPFMGWQSLDTDLQFFHDLDDKHVYFYSTEGNPGERFDSIELSPRQNGIAVGSATDVTVDNLCVKFAGAHGVGAGTTKNLTVTDCEFAWIGGSIQSYTANGDTTPRPTRFGNAIEIYGGCDGFTVDNCYIRQVYDAGITHQYKSQTEQRDMTMKHIRYTNNVIEYCHYSIEFFLDVGPGNDSCIDDCVVSDCLMRYSGMGFGEQRPDHNEASHIRGGRGHQNPMAENGFIVKDSLMLLSGQHLICAVSNPINDKYAETSQIVFEGNTYVQTSDGSLGYFETNDKATHAFNANAAEYIKKFDKTSTVYYAD